MELLHMQLLAVTLCRGKNDHSAHKLRKLFTNNLYSMTLNAMLSMQSALPNSTSCMEQQM